MARGLLAAVIGLAGAVVGVGLGGCTTNPATGKSIFTMGMSRQTQISLGNQAAPQFRQEMGGSVPDERLQRYVDDIGRRMAALTEGDNPSLPWEFNLVNSSQVNAFALPGGKVFFTRGLAEKLTSEAQMAGVIGHEIGHVTAEHGAQRMASTIAFNAGLVATAVIVGVSGDRDLQRIAAVGVPAIAVGGNLVLLKFGRNEELEADRLGVRYMVGAGYNPRGQMEVMQVLASLSTGPRPPEFLSTHPDPSSRVEQVQELLRGEYAYTQGNPKYQDHADRYRTAFLDVLRSLPPPPPTKQASLILTPDQAARAMGMTLAQYEAEFNYDDPTTWCAHCRTSAVAARQAQPEPAGGVRNMLARAAMGQRSACPR